MAASGTDYYRLLGVDRTTEVQGIREAFRREALRWHPDHRPGDPRAAERFRELHQAYEVLTDPARRRAYDAKVTERSSEHPDVEAQVTVGLREVFTGLLLKLRVPHASPCEGCGGTGRELGAQQTGCPGCGGSGWGPPESLYGLRLRPLCGVCHGLGSTGERPARRSCPDCHGLGALLLHTLLEVRVPAGVEDGMRLRVPGQGHPLLRGGAGDLVLVIHVRPGPWDRQGPDITFTLPVPARVLRRGGRVPLATPLERFTVRVPRGSDAGSILRVPGKGLPRAEGGGRGDLVLRLERVAGA
jgi:molecular chaperone DnaJ